jgi:Zn-finger nucleic acid-binding protein
MQCPVCHSDLSPATLRGITIDGCAGGCGGVWFDNFELKKFLQQPEAVGEIIARFRPREGGFFDYTRRRQCPRCGDVVMMRHYYTPSRRTEVDTCPGCNGVWLDGQELGRIQSEVAASRKP